MVEKLKSKIWAFIGCQLLGHEFLAGTKLREDGKRFCARCQRYVRVRQELRAE